MVAVAVDVAVDARPTPIGSTAQDKCRTASLEVAEVKVRSGSGGE